MSLLGLTVLVAYLAFGALVAADDNFNPYGDDTSMFPLVTLLWPVYVLWWVVRMFRRSR